MNNKNTLQAPYFEQLRQKNSFFANLFKEKSEFTCADFLEIYKQCLIHISKQKKSTAFFCFVVDKIIYSVAGEAKYSALEIAQKTGCLKETNKEINKLFKMFYHDF